MQQAGARTKKGDRQTDGQTDEQQENADPYCLKMQTPLM